MLRYLFLIFCLSVPRFGMTKVVYDNPDVNLSELIRDSGDKYIIKYHHSFEDTLFVPKDCELKFDGGSLSGPIVFSNTKLSGKVNLKGSSIWGSIKNHKFDASWLCYMDGIKDDAPHINEMIEVCGHIFFPSGAYRLISSFNPKGHVSEDLYAPVKAHVGIYKSNVILEGDSAVFVTEEPLVSICIFSQPNQIDKSISNVKIRNIVFEVHNNGKEFHDFSHTIKTIGVNGLYIEKCSFFDFWGDAICLSHYGDNIQTGERTRNSNVKILNNIIIGGDHHNNRNGISVINGKNVLIKGNTIQNTSRKDMPGGVDVEPNNSAYTIDNIIISNNCFEKVRTNAIQVYIQKDSPAHNIVIENNSIISCGNGLYIGISSDRTTSNFKIINNSFDNKTNPYFFGGKGHSSKWVIKNNIFARPCYHEIPGDIVVENLVINNNKKKE